MLLKQPEYYDLDEIFMAFTNHNMTRVEAKRRIMINYIFFSKKENRNYLPNLKNLQS